MDNILRQIDIDESLVFYTENQYSQKNRKKFLDVFQKLQSDEKIRSSYQDTVWICSSDIRTFQIDFGYKEYLYKTHIGQELGISPAKMNDMLKCYAVYICGVFIFRTISQKITSLKSFLTCFGDPAYKVKEQELMTIADFLGFIGTPEHQVAVMMDQIPFIRASRPRQRELSHLINYMAIENELTDMYGSSAFSDEEFLYWFPVYFWAKITFILPLRATEMLVTPCDCLEYKDDRIFLKVRRTMLKKGTRTVHYDVDKDYLIFTYQIPASEVVHNIEKYQALTSGHERRFLFDYSKYSINGILSLSSFNLLLAEFVRQYLIDNHKYDYSRFASGIQEFDLVSAGDSRPIAMANLFYQDIGADICRQLADHTNINVSAGYYTNVSNTVLASSIMHLQRKLNHGRMDNYQKKKQELQAASPCSSPRQPFVTGDIADCVAEGHIEECFGCRYHTPSAKELSMEMRKRKEKLDTASRKMIECMANGKDIIDQMDKLFLDAHTGITRYRTACNEKAEEELKKWERHKPTPMTSC